MRGYIKLMGSVLLGIGGFLALLSLMTVITPRVTASSPPDGYVFATGGTLTPFGPGQPSETSRRNAYKALFHAIYNEADLYWTAVTVTVDGTDYAPGAVIGSLGGDFSKVSTSKPISVPKSFSLHPVKIALFHSTVRDEYNQMVTWEEGDFEQLLRVYLWCPLQGERCTYFDTVSEADIANGSLAGYDVLILPSIRLGWADEVATALGDAGLQAIRTFVEDGGFLYAQSNAAYLVEQASILPVGTVDVNTRVLDDNTDNVAHLHTRLPDHPLTFSWLDDSTYLLNEPLITATTALTVVATFADTTQPGSVALAWRPFGQGKAVLFNGHPSDKIAYYPQSLDALLWAMGRRATIRGNLCQTYRGNVPCNLIPAYEPDVPIQVTTTFKNLWDEALTGIRITETVQPGFTVLESEVTPAPKLFYTTTGGHTIIVWEPEYTVITGTATMILDGYVPPGEWHGTYIARTVSQTMKSGTALVSQAQALYFDRWDDRYYTVHRNDLYVSAKMAARLQGDRDIELDAIYPLRDQGEYFDIALTLENKEETDARRTRITDVVALISPIVDVDNQQRIPGVLTDSWGISTTDSLSDALWAVNEVFFYHTPVPVYPLPVTIDGVPSGAITVGMHYGLDDWLNGPRPVYTYTGHFTTTPGFSESITIPPGYEQFITITAEGDVLLPALRLAWDYGDFPAYDSQEPAVRYGIFSRELLSRTVSFASDPVTPSLVLDASGGSVFTNLGGHPIPYHEYLRSGIVHVPIPPEMPQVSWQDVWSRTLTMTLRTVFYDIVPFPPPEYHAVVNTTFEMLADRNGDGVGDTRVLEFPTREGADINFYIKSWSDFYPGLNLEQDETLISQGMFRGLGYKLGPRGSSWWDSWASPNLQGVPTATRLITVVSTPALDYLYFQQYLQAQKREAIYVSATLSAYPHVHKEGVMKVDDGARFVYHQKAAGPSRYEIYDAPVQAAFGLSSDARANKWVAPARIATYNDEVYHFIRIRDPYDPRDPGWGPYIKSYGFWDSAATTYVGGRHRDEVLFPRVRPGDKTQIRVEIRNNQNGITLTNLVITPTAPAGITVTLRSVTETKAIEPIFFDFPFLHLSEVPEGWRTVWYYDVEVSPDFTDTGKVQNVTFDVSAGGLPGDFQIPPAEIRIEDASGNVQTVWGQATALKLTDVLPPWATPLAARLANGNEKGQLEQYLALGQTYTATNYFLGLRPTNFITASVANGSLVSFTLPVSDTYDATQIPWLEKGKRNGTMWVILQSNAQVDWSGTATINYAPVITYTDPFDQIYADTGNRQTVESHGPWLVVTYTVNKIFYPGEGDVSGDGLWPGEANLISATLETWNRGDYIAQDTFVTTVLTSGATLLWAAQPPSVQGDGFVGFSFGDLAPNDVRAVDMQIVITPTVPVTGTSAAQVGSSGWYVMDHTDGHFAFDFLQAQGSRQVRVDRPLAGMLWLPKAHRVFRKYMPLVFKNYSWTWWPKE